MKKFIMVLVLLTLIAGLNFSQESNNTNLYTLFFNAVNDQFKFPLLGFVNIAVGNHSLPQIGFINWNTIAFFINPEVISYNTINERFQHYLSVVPY